MLALALLAPLLIPIVIILSMTGEKEIFYRQSRIGKDGKIFYLLKFATMLKNSPALGTGDITVRNDPRVLPVGHFLRKTKINEIPQILNILKGDMSLVGPRPLTPTTFGYYDATTQQLIKQLKPGLTGIGSIVFRDEESILARSSKDSTSCYKEDIAPYKGELEKWYFKNQSLKIDFLIIVLTAWAILFPESRAHEKLFNDLPVPGSDLFVAIHH